MNRSLSLQKDTSYQTPELIALTQEPFNVVPFVPCYLLFDYFRILVCERTENLSFPALEGMAVLEGKEMTILL